MKRRCVATLPLIQTGRARSLEENGAPLQNAARDTSTRVLLEHDVASYFEREVKPNVPDAWMDRSKEKVDFEIILNRHFHVFKAPRPLAAVDTDLKAGENKILRPLREVTT
jgi:hypothetical protein